MQRDRLHILLEKYQQGVLTPAEWDELLTASEENPAVETIIYEDLGRRWGIQDQTSESAMEAALARILAVDSVQPYKRPARISYFRRYGIAASIIFLLAAGGYWWLSTNINRKHAVVAVNTDIQPGKQGALLTLSDGSQISLDSLKNGIVAQQNGATARLVNGTLVYEGTGRSAVYNIMSTPKGRQIQLSLPDGTKVWLNAASSIRFPTAFTSEKRAVKVTGEAYFEVTKNPKAPFSVIVNDTAEVQILGTHFNINAYPDEHSIKTTLFEGSVKVGWLGREPVLLKPGQQASMQPHKDGQASGIDVTSLDASVQENVLAWKNGFFNFEGATLKEIMRQVERWYDIDVEFEKGVRNIEFVGEMSRDASFPDFLVALDKSEIHYKLEGRKLTIKP